MDDNTSFWRQFFMVSIVSVGTIIAGCMNGWSAPALMKLKSGREIFNITNAEGTDLTLYAEIGHFVAPIPGGLLADYFGRVPMFTISAACSLLGWTLLTCGTNFTYYAIARIVLGFSFAIHCILMTIYIAEICGKNVRGTFASTSMFTLNTGILLQFFLGSMLSLRATNAFTFGLCVLQAISLYFLKESPYFLIASGQDERAKGQLMWLRASDSDVVCKEFAGIKERVQIRRGLLRSAACLFAKNNYKGFSLCMAVSSLSDLTGRVAILTFVTKTFSEVNPSYSNLMTIFLGVCNVLFPAIPILWSDKVGRKAILVASTVVAVFTHLLSGLVFVLLQQGYRPSWVWILFASLTGYLCANSACTSCVLTLRGEIISENCRGVASGFSSMAVALSTVVSTKSFQLVSDRLGYQYAFWLLACFGLLLIFYTWVFIPETKNKNFEEIQLALYKVKAREQAVAIETTKI